MKSALSEEPIGVINKENFNLDDLKAEVQPSVMTTKCSVKNEKNRTYHLSNTELKNQVLVRTHYTKYCLEYYNS